MPSHADWENLQLPRALELKPKLAELAKAIELEQNRVHVPLYEAAQVAIREALKRRGLHQNQENP